MKNTMSVLAVVLLSACGVSFEERSEQFAESICSFAQKCLNSVDYQECYQDVVTEMGEAKTKLDEAGQQKCMECMRVRVEAFDKSADNSCQQVDSQPVIGACGPDADNACAGYP